MSSADVQAIEALGELRTALLRFKSDAQSAMQSTLAEANRTRTFLDERLRYWQSELKRRINQYQEAEAAYRTCKARAYRDPETGRIYEPDCSREETNLRRARQLVEEAQNNVRIIQMHIKRVEEAFTSYQRQASRMSNMLESELSKATTLLATSVSILMGYASGG
jgi:hypothetical protein